MSAKHIYFRFTNGTNRGNYDMQSDINKIFKWCETLSMELNPEKCKVLHLGKQTKQRIISL